MAEKNDVTVLGDQALPELVLCIMCGNAGMAVPKAFPYTVTKHSDKPIPPNWQWVGTSTTGELKVNVATPVCFLCFDAYMRNPDEFFRRFHEARDLQLPGSIAERQAGTRGR